MTNWFTVRKRQHYVEMGYPKDIALAQAQVDLDALVHHAYITGATQREIGKNLKLTPARVFQMVHRHAGRLRRKKNLCPLVTWGNRLDPDWIKHLRTK